MERDEGIVEVACSTIGEKVDVAKLERLDVGADSECICLSFGTRMF